VIGGFADIQVIFHIVLHYFIDYGITAGIPRREEGVSSRIDLGVL